MVRIAGFHPADPGSIPGDEVNTCIQEVKGIGLISTDVEGLAGSNPVVCIMPQ